MQGYEEIFNQRGTSYHLAMEKYPHARDEEFLAAARRLIQQKNSTILDLPAGGGYLQKHLKKGVNYIAYDFSGEFNDNHQRIKKCREGKIDLPDESVDEIVSLAAFHHIVAREEFYAEMNRILKPGGRLILGDVVSGGKLDRFLNGFLDQWNSMGHNGRFIEDKDFRDISRTGFNLNFETEQYLWNFDTKQDAIDFFRLLFCLDLKPSDQEVIEAFLELGVSENNGYSIAWELGFITCEK